MAGIAQDPTSQDAWLFSATLHAKGVEALIASLWEQAGVFLETHSVPDTARYSVRLWLEELLTNLSKYGRPDGETPLEVEGSVRCMEHGALCLTLTDNGVPFDPQSHACADTESEVEKRQIGGLGLFLLFQRFTAFSYRRENNLNVGEWVFAGENRQ